MGPENHIVDIGDQIPRQEKQFYGDFVSDQIRISAALDAIKKVVCDDDAALAK